MKNSAIHRLEKRGIKPTANRILVMQELERATAALSMSDLEARLGTVDKSSVFRVLTLFADNHLIHSINDTTGQTKYALCPDDCPHIDNPHLRAGHEHIHFHCERCGQTFCLPSRPIPEIELPGGFHPHSVNMVFTGLCPECITKYGCKK